MVGLCPDNGGYGAQPCLHVAVTGCLATPWTAVDVGLSLNDPDDGIVVGGFD